MLFIGRVLLKHKSTNVTVYVSVTFSTEVLQEFNTEYDRQPHPDEAYEASIKFELALETLSMPVY